MIRNILYSLFLHLIIALLVYTNLNFYKSEEKNDDKSKNTVVFLVKINTPKKPAKKDLKKTTTIKKEKNINPEEKKTKIKKSVKPKEKLKNYPKINQNRADKIIKKKPNKIEKETEKEIEKEIEKETEKEVEKEEEIKIHNLKPLISPQLETDNSLPDLQDEFIFNTTDLSVREKFNIQLQIKRCYKRAIKEARVDGRVPVNVHIVIAKDGTIDLDLLKIQDFDKYNNPKEIDFHIAVDNVKKAITFCSPLRNLPKDKYELWRELNLQFDDDVKKINNIN